MATSVTVSSGQTYQIASGQTDTFDTVLDGGTLIVESGGAVSVLAGGVESTILLEEVGATETVSSGGMDLSGSNFGFQDIFGIASGGENQGVQQIESGGIASGVFVGNGGSEIVFGSALST